MSHSAVEDIHQLFRLRRSGRAYDATHEVSSHDIAAVFEAARWAPSGGNLQPWRYVYASKEDGANYERLLDLLSPHNRDWAQHAPVLILTAAATTRVNAQGETIANPTALHDLGMANLSISLEAVQRGLMAHMIGGFDKDRARDFLADDVQPVCMMILGYPGDPSLLSEHNQEREAAPRTRKPVEDWLRRL
jgi:nitroreductase